MLPPLRSVSDQRFSWLRNVSLSLSNSVQQCQGNFTKVGGQKMFISWQTYEELEVSVN